MIQGPIPRVLSVFLKHRVQALLMGGQACILYGAAEFSRDIDFAVMVSSQSIERLNSALNELDVKRIFMPALSEEVLMKGHACHFRCGRPDVKDLRIDIMGVMRGVSPFPDLWKRRKEVKLSGIGKVPVMALIDLVAAKKTQRDKDWYMIRRLIEADVYKRSANPPYKKISFWFTECRTPELLVSLAAKYPDIAAGTIANRPLLKFALKGNTEKISSLMRDEEDREKELDRRYWRPLRAELEKWRHKGKKRAHGIGNNIL